MGSFPLFCCVLFAVFMQLQVTAAGARCGYGASFLVYSHGGLGLRGLCSGDSLVYIVGGSHLPLAMGVKLGTPSLCAMYLVTKIKKKKKKEQIEDTLQKPESRPVVRLPRKK